MHYPHKHSGKVKTVALIAIALIIFGAFCITTGLHLYIEDYLFGVFSIYSPNFDIFDVRLSISDNYIVLLIFSIRNNGGRARHVKVTVSSPQDWWRTETYVIGDFPKDYTYYDLKINYSPSFSRGGLQVTLNFNIIWDKGSQQITRVLPVR